MTANDVLSRFGLRPIAGGERVRDVSDSEVEYYLRCPFCGQVYDAGDPDAVLVHDEPLPHLIEVP
jgi:hypothetical protein